MDTFADGLPILHEAPCWTPDGRLAWVEPFKETPMARVKDDYDPRLDLIFEGRECYSKPLAEWSNPEGTDE